MAGSWKKVRGALNPESVRGVIFNPENSMPLMVVLFVMEMFINVWVITNIKCKLIGVLLLKLLDSKIVEHYRTEVDM